MMPGRPITEEKKRKKRERERERERQNSIPVLNSSNLVEEFIPQILFLHTKPFVIFTDAVFQVDAYESFSFVQE